MLKIVYDTNVIVSAALKEKSLPALVLSLALEGSVRMVISPALMKEYEEVLNRPRLKLGQEEVKELVAKMKDKALMVKPRKELKIFKQDMPDNRILECALKGKADFIITGNKKHFTFGEFRGTKIVTPREFINEMGKI
jgi:putative PIN family toxin of toxin-antitoxin system